MLSERKVVDIFCFCFVIFSTALVRQFNNTKTIRKISDMFIDIIVIVSGKNKCERDSKFRLITCCSIRKIFLKINDTTTQNKKRFHTRTFAKSCYAKSECISSKAAFGVSQENDLFMIYYQNENGLNIRDIDTQWIFESSQQ